ncbi:STAS domain-containing protein [Mycobacterium sp. SMC-4]|uniref:STAS domain-containing protein n=1 Tax=Mycobacterium sp. SMC-4 TaxID=2857059 RepID=UPI0021B18B8B|nr:STAS domain-containing protein [Mycobacterium sp. SMC-4]UXA16054.1 STAS domain-containing protein [Mycobacterium sp. SMC-4]
MSAALTIDTARNTDGSVTVVACGEVDLSNVEAFQRVLAGAADSAPAALVVDLSGVEYVDSAGINVLFGLRDHIDKVVAHPLLMTTFTVSGLTELTTVEPAAER